MECQGNGKIGYAVLDSKKKGEYTVCKKKKSSLDNSLSKFSRSHARASVFFSIIAQ